MKTGDVERLAAFAEAGGGGNPAGVAILETPAPAAEMQRVAAEIGYSETAFLTPLPGAARWRTRYFAPQMEVPFCGHATIAAGAALGARFGPGVYPLALNDGEITVEALSGPAGPEAALVSQRSWSAPAEGALGMAALDLFGLGAGALADEFSPALAGAGARHLILVLRERAQLAAVGPGRPLDYDLNAGKALMDAHGLITIALITRESDRLYHARNAFAAGGVAEDPATGAAAAAFGGLLRDAGRSPSDGRFEILQGADMQAPSRIRVETPPEPGAPVRVSGAVRPIA